MKAAEGAEQILLVVDDAAPLRRLVALVLAKSGYKVREADCGNAALDIIVSQGARVGLLLTDLSMPQMNGFDLIRAARQLVPGLKILAMTGSYTYDEIEGELLELGLSYLLHKPFSHIELINAVDSIVKGADFPKVLG